MVDEFEGEKFEVKLTCVISKYTIVGFGSIGKNICCHVVYIPLM